MKTKVLLLALLGLAGLTRPAHAGPPVPYTATVQITPGASPSHILAFQNTSTSQDIYVDRIDVVSVTTQAVTGGLEQFWVYGSTSLTHSVVVSSAVTASYRASMPSQPAALVMSTAPINVLLERDAHILTAAQRNNISGISTPLIPPLYLNLDEGATTNFKDAWTAEPEPDFNGAGAGILLPAGANRALVIEKRRVGATDFTAGTLFLRIRYYIR